MLLSFVYLTLPQTRKRSLKESLFCCLLKRRLKQQQQQQQQQQPQNKRKERKKGEENSSHHGCDTVSFILYPEHVCQRSWMLFVQESMQGDLLGDDGPEA